MADAPTVTVRLPGLLSRFTGGNHRVTVHAETVASCVDALLECYPTLEPHLHDDEDLRAHLELFHNGQAVAADAADEVALEDGDEVVVLQAVSGG